MDDRLKTKAQNKQLAPMGLRAFFKLSDIWGLNVEEQMILLGRPSRSTFYNWRAGKISGVPHDTLSRLSHIIAIQHALNTLFDNAEQAVNWVKKENAQLAGQTALDRLLGGELIDLYFIRTYLDGLMQPE
ncbi:MAG: MbcA/ParS/Xre antitoxin family protein [Kordiimonadaceae bacterium]|nr:MbcA/ParS/Xre antitoxin family protein [Kordiimonadaceae bacterium]